MEPDLGRWDPLSQVDVVDVLRGLDRPWWVAGGWAIDLHLGRQTREHADLDVLVLREDLRAVQRHLACWDVHAADPPGSLRPWAPGEVLPARVHDLWCRRTPSSPWSLQLMVDDAPHGTWTYRRDGRVTRPVDELAGPASDAERAVLAPEVQLLQKSSRPRAKDEADLVAALPHLDDARRAWLVSSLTTVTPGHPWLALLQRGQDGS